MEVHFPLHSFADHLGTLFKVSGVLGHGLCLTVHCKTSSPKTFCTYSKWELLLLTVILCPVSSTKTLSLISLFFFWVILSKQGIDIKKSIRSTVTSPPKEAYLPLFLPKATTFKINYLHSMAGGDLCAEPCLFTVCLCNIVLFFHQDSCTSSLTLPVLPRVTLSSENCPGKLLSLRTYCTMQRYTWHTFPLL